jgi:DNA repair protein SbcD/Mre11
MIRLLHMADLHLGAEPTYLGDLASKRSLDYSQAFRRAVDYAVDLSNRIDAVVIAGDLFDRPCPPSEIYNLATAELRRLKQTGIPVVLVPGNHDALGYPHSAYADAASEIRQLVHFVDCPNPGHVATLSLQGNDVHFYGMAWDCYRSHTPFDSFQAVAASGYHVAVLHGTLDTGRYAELYDRDVPLRLAMLGQSGMDYVALGHLHAFQLHHAGAVPVVYPGTLEGRRFTPAEEGERYLVAVTIEKGKTPTLEKLRWNARTMQSSQLDIDHEAVENEGQLANLIRSRYGGSDRLLHLELRGTPPFVIDADSIESQLISDFFWIDVQDNTDLFENNLVASWAGEDTIRGLYVRRLQQKLAETSDEVQQRKVEMALKLGFQALSKSARR